jgi:5-methylcytosine-specific restriction endonuclease McrA
MKTSARDLDKIKEWQRANQEKVKAIKAAWKKANPEKVKAINRVWYLANRQKAYANTVSWRTANPDKARAAVNKRRSALGSITAKEILEIMSNPCAYCGKASEHLEHCTPLSRGGWNTPDNCAAACARCNRAKGSQTVLEFLGLLKH